MQQIMIDFDSFHQICVPLNQLRLEPDHSLPVEVVKNS